MTQDRLHSDCIVVATWRAVMTVCHAAWHAAMAVSRAAMAARRAATTVSHAARRAVICTCFAWEIRNVLMRPSQCN